MNTPSMERILGAILPSYFAKKIAKSPKIFLFLAFLIVIAVFFIIKVVAFAIYILTVLTVLFSLWAVFNKVKSLQLNRKSNSL